MATSGEQSAGGGSAARASKLRYPLRSASKGKAAVISPAADAPPTISAPRRAKPSSDVSKSMCLDLSVKEKSAKPPRRHSIQTKPGASPRPTPSGTVTTPVSRRSGSQWRIDTPTSEASMSMRRRKFSTLSSISYWMTQIRLAEAASKHSVSLGFFKLALESECEPLDRMREELKSYVARHGLATELEDPVKDILQVYDIVEDFEKLKISAEPSQQPKKSDKAARTATDVSPNGNLKPRSLNSDATESKEAGKKESIQKVKPDAKVRSSYNRNPVKNTAAKEVVANGKKTKKEAKGQQEVSNGGSEALSALPDQESVDVVKQITHEDKENMGDIEMAVDVAIAQDV
ncbi:histone H1-I-like [Miscanthus floridulus]|uniref:histone H1-I-like n=1 Tax=Miscanthus floridulus TaxID=154761 RepID=UPI00345ACF10